MPICRYAVLFGLLALLSCRYESAPSASFIYLISTYASTTAKTNFDQCTIRYAFRNNSKTLNISNLQKTLEIPFDQWQQANGYLDFTRVAAEAVADISFVFSDSLQAGNVRTDVGLLTQPIGILSQLVRQTNGTYTVYLSNTHHWEIGSLQRVMLFQIGAALGLPASANPASAMYNQLTTTSVALDTADIGAIQRLYKQPCDQWTRLADLPFNGRYIETSVATPNRGFVLLNAAEGQSAFWEFSPTSNSWRPRTPYTITQADQYGFSPSRLAFAIDTLIFVGNGYNNIWDAGKSGTFWQYKPAVSLVNDQWIPIVSQPQIGYGSGRSFSLNGKGYLVTMNLNASGLERIAVCVYDPVAKTWVKPLALERKSYGVFSLDETFGYVLNQQAYLVAPDASLAKSWLFDPTLTNLWAEIGTFNNTSQTKTGFAVRDAGYGISGTINSTKGVWQYKSERSWKRMKDFDGRGSLMFSFVVGNRAYVGMSTGQFWMYRP